VYVCVIYTNVKKRLLDKETRRVDLGPGVMFDFAAYYYTRCDGGQR